MAGDQAAEQRQEDFKEQLDRVAEERRSGADNQQTNPIVEKITEYVPAASKVLGGSKEFEPHTSNSENTPGPPNRPDHDHKIEDFVRDQHRSKTKDGTLN
ncbi:hypothetical protein ACO1O0_008840 [Amphichorda felina]